jgi:hypothetical protein
MPEATVRRPPPAPLLAALAVRAVTRVVHFGAIHSVVLAQRLRRLHRHRRPLAYAVALRRYRLLSVAGLVIDVVLAVFLLRGVRWAWWARVVLLAVGVAVSLPSLLTRPRPVLGVLLALSLVELALLLTPPVRAYYSPPR